MSNSAERRLLRDLAELERNPNPLIVARPLSDSSLLLWHGNMRGAEAPFDQTVFHFTLEFPSTYPRNPPRCRLCTELSHYNVFKSAHFGGTKAQKEGYLICLDMLEELEWGDNEEKAKKYTGWTSAYSVASVLVNLQSFLMDPEAQHEWGCGHLSATKNANQFKCTHPECKHDATKKEIYPTFPSEEIMEKFKVSKIALEDLEKKEEKRALALRKALAKNGTQTKPKPVAKNNNNNNNNNNEEDDNVTSTATPTKPREEETKETGGGPKKKKGKKKGERSKQQTPKTPSETNTSPTPTPKKEEKKGETTSKTEEKKKEEKGRSQ